MDCDHSEIDLSGYCCSAEEREREREKEEKEGDSPRFDHSKVVLSFSSQILIAAFARHFLHLFLLLFLSLFLVSFPKFRLEIKFCFSFFLYSIPRR